MIGVDHYVTFLLAGMSTGFHSIVAGKRTFNGLLVHITRFHSYVIARQRRFDRYGAIVRYRIHMTRDVLHVTARQCSFDSYSAIVGCRI